MVEMFEKGFRLVQEIKKLEEGSTAYIVGGAVRDYILGKDCDDIDIATSVDIDIIEKHFPTYDIGNNKDFGILVVQFEGEAFEIANYRTDGDYTDGRRPDSVEIISTFEEDSKRRDFTINAMAMDEDKNILDYHGGIDDLNKGIIRTVGEAHDRFSEDHLRILRAIRFATVLDFKLHEDIECDIMWNGECIKNVATERIWKEVWKMALSDNFSKGVGLMDEFGILRSIFPEIANMRQYPHYRKHHPEGNVHAHVMSVVKHLDNKSAVVKLGGLFHDIGKPVSYEFVEAKNKFHYFAHDFKGLAEWTKVVDRIHIPKDIAEAVAYCIKNHMKMHYFLRMKDSKCYRLMDSPHWDTLYDVAYADDQSRLYLFDRQFWNALDAKVERLHKVLDLKTKINKVVDGHLVMEVLGIKGGREVGEVLKKARAYVIDNNIHEDVADGYGVEVVKKYIRQFK